MNNALHTSLSTAVVEDPAEIIEAIVDPVADAEGVPPLELEPLVTAIDPDALTALCRHGESETTVEFRYHGYRIRVSSADHVAIEIREG